MKLVLWHGAIGGAESFSVMLARRLRDLGAAIEVVFLGQANPLAERLCAAGVPYRSLGLKRGRDAVRHPRSFAREIALGGSDGALLVACGFLGAALRGGGYRPPIVAVEHGSLLAEQVAPRLRRYLMLLGRTGGALANSAEVGVSDFMLQAMRGHPHARRILRIYNGIDPLQYDASPPRAHQNDEPLRVGFAGRLIAGKGADHLINAVARVHPEHPIKLLIAGEGIERTRLELLTRATGIQNAAHFVGQLSDMSSFWKATDLAVIPSEVTESFSMSTLESMACARPSLATLNGGIPELVVDGFTGALVPPRDVAALARAMVKYARQPELLPAHGAAARTRAIAHFHIDACAKAYLDLFAELSDASKLESRQAMPPVTGAAAV